MNRLERKKALEVVKSFIDELYANVDLNATNYGPSRDEAMIALSQLGMHTFDTEEFNLSSKDSLLEVYDPTTGNHHVSFVLSSGQVLLMEFCPGNEPATELMLTLEFNHYLKAITCADWVIKEVDVAELTKKYEFSVIGKILALEDFNEVETTDDLYDMGFRGIGRLCSFPGHESECERNWVAEHMKTGQQIVFYDEGNSYCKVTILLYEPVIASMSSEKIT